MHFLQCINEELAGGLAWVHGSVRYQSICLVTRDYVLAKKKKIMREAKGIESALPVKFVCAYK